MIRLLKNSTKFESISKNFDFFAISLKFVTPFSASEWGPNPPITSLFVWLLELSEWELIWVDLTKPCEFDENLETAENHHVNFFKDFFSKLDS